MPLTWTVVHPIDSESPLWGVTPEEFEQQQAEVLILIKAYDDTFSQTVFSRYLLPARRGDLEPALRAGVHGG